MYISAIFNLILLYYTLIPCSRQLFMFSSYIRISSFVYQLLYVSFVPDLSLFYPDIFLCLWKLVNLKYFSFYQKMYYFILSYPTWSPAPATQYMYNICTSCFHYIRLTTSRIYLPVRKFFSLPSICIFQYTLLSLVSNVYFVQCTKKFYKKINFLIWLTHTSNKIQYTTRIIQYTMYNLSFYKCLGIPALDCSCSISFPKSLGILIFFSIFPVR